MFRTPDVNGPIHTSGQDELWVRAERGFNRGSFAAIEARECLEGEAVKSIDETNDGAVRGNHDGLPVRRELQGRPLVLVVVGEFKGGKRPLKVKGDKLPSYFYIFVMTHNFQGCLIN